MRQLRPLGFVCADVQRRHRRWRCGVTFCLGWHLCAIDGDGRRWPVVDVHCRDRSEVRPVRQLGFAFADVQRRHRRWRCGVTICLG